MGGGGTDWIDLAQDRYRWRELLNAEMNLWVPQKAGTGQLLKNDSAPCSK